MKMKGIVLLSLLVCLSGCTATLSTKATGSDTEESIIKEFYIGPKIGKE
jgi:uncharacterized protein YceK